MSTTAEPPAHIASRPPSLYTHDDLGCRCPDCKAIRSAYMAEWRQSTKGQAEQRRKNKAARARRAQAHLAKREAAAASLDGPPPGPLPFPRGANTACTYADRGLFYAASPAAIDQAKRICGDCPFREACLQWALDNDERFGIWGGKSERERRKIVKQREAARPGVAA